MKVGFLLSASVICLVCLGSCRGDIDPTFQNKCRSTFPVISKTEALQFLSNGKRATPRACCEEGACESFKNKCFTEQFRALIVDHYRYACPAGQSVAVTSWCVGHISYECRDPCLALGVARCLNGGTCRTRASSWYCDCLNGYTSDICQTDINECLNNPCHASGSTSCDNLNGSFICNCRHGYKGVYCQLDIDECGSHPCNTINTVQCINSIGSYRCLCKSGFTGHHCDTDIDECLNDPCIARYSLGCQNLIGSFKCNCKPGYEGVNCQTDTNECLNNPCHASGSMGCENLIGSFKCNCRHGYKGVYCQLDIDECLHNPCNARQSVGCENSPGSFTCHCRRGYEGVRCQLDIDECGSHPCNTINTVQCINSIGSYRCLCKNGFTGHHCDTDIDDCLNNSCQNGATCMDLVNGYKCICPDGFYGTLCDTNICRPLPADVVFVLDSSVSMTESQFNKQLEFVSNFTDEIRLGPRDFQIAVITYSFKAHIEFYLNTYRDNVTMKEAIANITYKPGITNTHLALERVQELFAPGHGGDVPRYNNTMADRFVYLLTDGLSNKAQRTVQAATTLKHGCGITVTAIGIGVQVSHAELYKVASPSLKAGNGVRQVYSVQNFNSLYTVLKDLVHFDCTECKRSKKSDVAVVMDTSYTMTDVQLALLQNALTSVVENVHLGENETNISFITFGSSIQLEFGFKQYTQLADILARLHTVSLSTGKPKVGIFRVLSYVKDNVLTAGRPDARSFIIVAGNGNYSVSDSIKYEELKSTFKTNGVDIFAIGSGSDVSMTDLELLSSDPFNVFVVTEDNRSAAHLSAIQSSFVYSECDLQ